MSNGTSRTSESHPIRVDFVSPDALRTRGGLGMTFAPGMKDFAASGRWERDLDADLLLLKERYDADALVSLMREEEYRRYGVPDLAERATEAGIEVINFPITDVSTPEEAEAREYEALVDRIAGLLHEGRNVVVHCRGGLGRTGTVAASTLVALGHAANDAIAEVRRVRPGTVETFEQEEYVRRFERQRLTRRQEPAQAERYRGALLGLAAGDALGAAVEFAPPGSFEPVADMIGGGPHGLEAGQWTDDTSMALCLAESLVESEGFDPVDQMRRYVRWYREGYLSSTGELFDIGNATREALERFERTGEPYAGSTDPERAGNGSIMRLAPVPMFYARGPLGLSGGPVEAIERCGESSSTTHGARICVDACRYLGALIVGALNGADRESLLSEGYCPVGGYWQEMPLCEEVSEVAAGSFKRRQPPQIRGRGYVVASLEAALWAFYNSDSFEQGALLAVNLGDDADTTGAVYGQLAGAFYGEKEIPEAWRRKLTHRSYIEGLAESLLRRGQTMDWTRLLSLLPAFEQTDTVSGEQVSGEYMRFMEALYQSGALYIFEWSRLHEEAERLFENPRALKEAEEPTLRQLLTFHARKDRFAEGHFDEILESGHITAILRRLQHLQESFE